jgi:hypothetical protein
MRIAKQLYCEKNTDTNFGSALFSLQSCVSHIDINQ